SPPSPGPGSRTSPAATPAATPPASAPALRARSSTSRRTASAARAGGQCTRPVSRRRKRFPTPPRRPPKLQPARPASRLHLSALRYSLFAFRSSLSDVQPPPLRPQRLDAVLHMLRLERRGFLPHHPRQLRHPPRDVLPVHIRRERLVLELLL